MNFRLRFGPATGDCKSTAVPTTTPTPSLHGGKTRMRIGNVEEQAEDCSKIAHGKFVSGLEQASEIGTSAEHFLCLEQTSIYAKEQLQSSGSYPYVTQDDSSADKRYRHICEDHGDRGSAVYDDDLYPSDD